MTVCLLQLIIKIMDKRTTDWKQIEQEVVAHCFSCQHHNIVGLFFIILIHMNLVISRILRRRTVVFVVF